MDRLEALFLASPAIRKPGQTLEAEDAYYCRYAPRPLRPLPALSSLAVVGALALALGLFF